MAAKNIDPLGDGVQWQSVESGTQDWVTYCGVCHVGGGQMEYDRNMNDYGTSSPSGDQYTYEYPSLQFPNGRLTTIDQAGGLSATNKAELDCLLCHIKTTDPAGTGNGRAWLQSMGCDSNNPMGPLNDPTCSGTSAYPGVPAAGTFTPGTSYDMYNRNLALKTKSYSYAASLGLGAVVSGWNADGTIASISGVPSAIPGSNIAPVPESANCSVCHARDDSTAGLPGMMQMKFGYGNFALVSPPGTALDTDKDASDPDRSNDLLWFELGCKTGMGKRAHKIGQGPNANWGMSMFNAMFGLGKQPGDPVVTETIAAQNQPFASMGMTVNVKERMPDADVHDINPDTHQPTGMSCGTCHYTLGSENKYSGGTRNPAYDVTDDQTDANSRVFAAGDHHGVPYPEETVRAIDHQFAQADSYPDTKSKNNLDGTVSCESCHTTRDNPRLTDNGGTLVSPTPTHQGFPAVHLEKIACATCHIPEVYAAPGRLKYRDWTAGQYKGGFRNMLDWNFDLITGSHKTVPVLHQWLTKEGEQKIYPVLPSVMPIWVKGSTNSGLDTGSEIAGGAYQTTNPLVAPVKARNSMYAAMAVKAQHPEFDIRLNGGNMVPLFDGFSLSDSWEVDTKAEIDAFTSTSLIVDGSQYANKMKLFQTNFDVTHGVAPAEWALGGEKRGGCLSCHSSIDPYTRNAMGMPTGENPNYSPYSVGFFEGYQQPLEGAAFGIGQYDMIKNWFALFADFDCTMMCGGGQQPDSTYFDQAGNPISDAACGDPMGMGWTTLGDCVDFMSNTFDKAMGFPDGTAKMMGMYDGIAGLQGFTVRETLSGLTNGCNPFAGPASMSPFPGYSVNNCMPSNNPMFNMGSCEGADPMNGMPGQCDSMSFRAGGACMADTDCNGVAFSAEEYAANPNGLLYQRSEARSHFKIALQQSGSGTAAKVTWPISVEKNPGNPNHVNSWDQAQTSCKDMYGMPAPCGDGMFINTTVHANQLLGYDSAMLAFLMAPKTRDKFAITASAGAGGSVAPVGTVDVSAGTDYTVYITADAGYQIADVLVDGVSVGAVGSYKFEYVTASHTLAASFVANPSYTISASAGANGTISPVGDTVALGGTDVTYTITPDAGYKLASLTVDGQPQTLWNSYTFHNVSGNHTINATFEQDVTYVITATAYAGGTISPAGSVAVSKGSDQTFTITPNAGYKVGRVVVDGKYKGAITSYTFTNVISNGHTIKVWFYVQ
ncbi:InlB B-repeat-containing protein [Thiovibrio sp. JS02]